MLNDTGDVSSAHNRLMYAVQNVNLEKFLRIVIAIFGKIEAYTSLLLSATIYPVFKNIKEP